MTGESGAIRRGEPAAAKPKDEGETADSAEESEAEPAGRDADGFILYRLPGHLIRRLQQVAVSIFYEEVEEAGGDVTPVQYAALVAINTYPKIDQAALAGVIAYDRTTIGGVVDRLEAKGLVRRTTSKNDRRVRQLVIEPAGQDLLDALADAVARAQDRMLAPLGAEERALFARLLSKLVAANNERSRVPARPIRANGGPKTKKK